MQIFLNVSFPPFSMLTAHPTPTCGSLLNLFRSHFLKNSSICLNQWFSTGVAFGPQETSGNVLTFLVVTADGWGRMLLAFYGQRTERQGSIQECTVHPKTSKHYSRSAGNPNQTQAPTKSKQREQALWVFLAIVVQLLSHVWLFSTPWTAAHQASPSFTISWSLLKLRFIESVMPSNHLILCSPLLLLPSIFSSIRVFSNELYFHIRYDNILKFQLQHQSFQWIFRVDFL